MEADVSAQTSPTLLGKLHADPGDAAAWGRFVDLYGPKIYGWCRYWNLQDADAQDVTQTVLLKLADKMRTFRYDPSRSFRAWLKTLTHHAWSDFVTGRHARDQGSGDTGVLKMLETVEAREDLVKNLETTFDLELLEAATQRVARVQANTWDAYRLTALEGLSGAQAAARLGMKVGHVFVAKSEVQKMLRAEVAVLESVGGG